MSPNHPEAMPCGTLRQRLLDRSEESRELDDPALANELRDAAHQVWKAWQLLSRVDAERSR